MQSSFYSSKYQAHSQTIITLNRQIEVLCPIRVSYQNLSKYHNKIAKDLESLIQQHDFTISSLRKSLQNILLIANRTQQQKNYMLEKMFDLENQNAKIIFDTKNLAQKLQSLSQKLKLEISQHQSNQSFRVELENTSTSLKNHCVALQNLNDQLKIQQNELNSQLVQVQKSQKEQKQKNCSLKLKADDKKTRIASINLKNEDLIDLNIKIEQEINVKEDEANSKNKLNRVLKQRMIELTSDHQKLKNQAQYKRSLLNAQKIVQIELQTNQKTVSVIIDKLQEQKAQNKKENISLQNDVIRLKTMKDENMEFKINSQNHLIELKKTNEILLQKMQQCCMEDREIQNILLKKMSTLQLFSKRLNRQYQFDREKTNMFKEKILLLNQKSLNVHRPSFIKQKIQQRFENTRTSSKSPWMKQNFA